MGIIVYLSGCYLAGNILVGYFLLRLLSGQNIMELGSGNPGARNAGRTHGKLAFTFTFLGDALKGAAAIWIGASLGFSDELQLMGAGAAVLGHMRPVLFKFRGGKGVSALLGGLIAFDPVYAAVTIAGFVFLFAVFRIFTAAGLASLLLVPVYQFVQGLPLAVCILTLTLILIVASAHLGDLKERRDQSVEK